MFGFYWSRLGCLGSLVVSIVLSVVLLMLARGCATSGSW
jgi:hypothetical protein